MMDVGEWLQGIGLRQYEGKFRDHGIDLDVLPDLTEADLKKLGVALGSRKRMMKAIAELDAAARGQPSSVRLAPAGRRRSRRHRTAPGHCPILPF